MQFGRSVGPVTPVGRLIRVDIPLTIFGRLTFGYDGKLRHSSLVHRSHNSGRSKSEIPKPPKIHLKVSLFPRSVIYLFEHFSCRLMKGGNSVSGWSRNIRECIRNRRVMVRTIFLADIKTWTLPTTMRPRYSRNLSVSPFLLL